MYTANTCYQSLDHQDKNSILQLKYILLTELLKSVKLRQLTYCTYKYKDNLFLLYQVKHKNNEKYNY